MGKKDLKVNRFLSELTIICHLHFLFYALQTA